MNIQVIASGSSGNAYRVSDGETSLLLDAGVPIAVLREALDFNLRSLGGCLITHEHQDHCKAGASLARNGIDVYMSAGTAEKLNAIKHHRVKTVRALEEVKIGSFKVLPFDVQHDAAEPLGFLLTSTATGEKLLYFTDTYYVKYQFRGVTHMLCECNYSMDVMMKSVADGRLNEGLAKRIIKSHMSLEHLLDFLKANDLSRLRQIYLLHMSNANGDEAAFGEAVRRLTGVEVYVC